MHTSKLFAEFFYRQVLRNRRPTLKIVFLENTKMSDRLKEHNITEMCKSTAKHVVCPKWCPKWTLEKAEHFVHISRKNRDATTVQSEREKRSPKNQLSVGAASRATRKLLWWQRRTGDSSDSGTTETDNLLREPQCVARKLSDFLIVKLVCGVAYSKNSWCCLLHLTGMFT